MSQKVNFLGMQFEVLSEAELLKARTAPEKAVQLCVRVADYPSPSFFSADQARRTYQDQCETCGETCWFDPKSGPGRLFVRVVCTRCALIETREAHRRRSGQSER